MQSRSSCLPGLANVVQIQRCRHVIFPKQLGLPAPSGSRERIILYNNTVFFSMPSCPWLPMPNAHRCLSEGCRVRTWSGKRERPLCCHAAKNQSVAVTYLRFPAFHSGDPPTHTARAALHLTSSSPCGADEKWKKANLQPAASRADCIFNNENLLVVLGGR